MKKTLFLGPVLICIGICGYLLFSNGNNTNTAVNNKPKVTAHASYTKIDGLNQLKKLSSAIVEIEGTDKYKIVDYKSIPFRISTVKVIKVLKGDKKLTEIKILQTEGLKSETPPANGERLLMFLRDSGEPVAGFTSLYTPIGGSQGIYGIKVKDNKEYLSVHGMANDLILKDISGNYEDVKTKIKD